MVYILTGNFFLSDWQLFVKVFFFLKVTQTLNEYSFLNLEHNTQHFSWIFYTLIFQMSSTVSLNRLALKRIFRICEIPINLKIKENLYWFNNDDLFQKKYVLKIYSNPLLGLSNALKVSFSHIHQIQFFFPLGFCFYS